ncbi:polysaccharide lyase family 14 protein [Macrolepiota fuliginosa MF-IS2]|uniref:Polysaccharide lyase family 14 protein n=1 Tax=Macrolepiota fuliginosa MF-IS2 TaxID=1400762 RepID=A0A9P5X8B7_9AGAR|nr:polysaccharide lyase family 14 protein [Macrolepiota fuliginosa MF-IS2]
MTDYLIPILPIQQFKNGFTTCEHLKSDRITLVQLEDELLGVHRVSSRTTHNIVTPPLCRSPSPAIPPPKKAWEAFYPEGSINPSAELPGGFGFYLSGPSSFAQQLEEGANEVLVSYRMMLSDDWEWVRGGKLPGFFGGIGPFAYNCTGGRQEDRCQCFNLRPMWRPKGVGELYTYLPLVESNSEILKKVPPQSIQDPNYGFSVGRGAFNWVKAVGNWIAVACRIKLNAIGCSDGEVQLWVDGEPVITVHGLLLRQSNQSIIKGMHFQTFFGGHTQEWASPKDQKAWFADVTGVVL